MHAGKMFPSANQRQKEGNIFQRHCTKTDRLEQRGLMISNIQRIEPSSPLTTSGTRTHFWAQIGARKGHDIRTYCATTVLVPRRRSWRTFFANITLAGFVFL